MLNLDTDYLIVRLETAFDLIQDIKKDISEMNDTLDDFTGPIKRQM